MNINNAWPLLLVLLLWVYKARINAFYQSHLNLFTSVWLNATMIFLYTSIILLTQVKITWQAVTLLVAVNILGDWYLMARQRK